MVKPYILFTAVLLFMTTASNAYSGEVSPCTPPFEFKITTGFPEGSCFCPEGQVRSYKIDSGNANLSPCVDSNIAEIIKPSFCSTSLDAQDLVDTGQTVKLIGNSDGDYSGSSLASAGDVNGDGYDDILLGAEHDDPNGSNSGSTYLIFGKASGWSSEIVLDTASLNSGVGVEFNGDDTGDKLGYAVAKTPGDFNGDGYDDILMSAYKHDGSGSDIGSIYLLWGKSGVFTHPMDTNDMNFTGDGDVAVKFEGNDDDVFAGYSLSSAGDFNGDGIDDIMIGAPEEYTATGNGMIYITFGKTSGWSDSAITLEHTNSYFNGVNGVRIVGKDVSGYQWAGNAVDTAGDFNGDGIGDVIIGAKYSSTDSNSENDSGAAYIVFGSAGPWTGNTENSMILDDLDGTNGFLIDGEDEGDEFGYSVSHIGDINGDGYDDVAIGAPYAEAGGGSTEKGKVYIIFGNTTWGSSFDVSTLDGSNGFIINGLEENDFTGMALSSAGDVNRDGIPDFLVGVPSHDTDIGDDKGAGYIIFGNQAIWDAEFDLTTLDGSNGFRVEGHGTGINDDDSIGREANYLGDIDGDGNSDLIIGGIYSAPEPYGIDKNDAGTSYVLFTDQICD